MIAPERRLVNPAGAATTRPEAETRSPEMVDDSPHFVHLPRDRVLPSTETTVRVHRGHRSRSRAGFHVGKVVEALGFEHERRAAIALGADEKVRHVSILDASS